MNSLKILAWKQNRSLSWCTISESKKPQELGPLLIHLHFFTCTPLKTHSVQRKVCVGVVIYSHFRWISPKHVQICEKFCVAENANVAWNEDESSLGYWELFTDKNMYIIPLFVFLSDFSSALTQSLFWHTTFIGTRILLLILYSVSE